MNQGVNTVVLVGKDANLKKRLANLRIEVAANPSSAEWNGSFAADETDVLVYIPGDSADKKNAATLAGLGVPTLIYHRKQQQCDEMQSNVQHFICVQADCSDLELFASLQLSKHRHQARIELLHRLEFETLLSAISTDFINLPPDQFDFGIRQALKNVARFTNTDRAFLFQYREGGTRIDNTHEYCQDGIPSQLIQHQNQFSATYSWFHNELASFNNVHVQKLSELPPQAAAERELWSQLGIRSIVCVPLFAHMDLYGGVGFESMRSERSWTEGDLRMLGIVAQIFANALNKRKNEEALRNQALLLERVSDAVVSTDLDLTIRTWNHAAETIYGYTAEEALYHRMDELLKTQWPAGESSEAVREQYLETGTWRGEVVQYTKAGDKIDVMTSVNLIRDAEQKAVGVVAVNRDLTTITKTREALIRSERHLEKAQKIAKLASWTVNLRTGSADWSTEINQIFGLDEDEQVDYIKLVEMTHPDDREKVKRLLDESVRTHTPFKVETRIITAQGEERIVEVQIDFDFDGEGNAMRLTGIARDITEREQYQEQIEQIARFPDEAPSPIFRINPDYKIIYRNKKAEEIQHHITLAGGIIRAPLRRFINTAVDAKETREFEYTIGDRIYQLSVVYLPEWDYVNIYANDITEQKRQENRFRALVETLNEGVLQVNNQGIIQYANPKILEITEYELDEMLGREVSTLLCWDEEDREKVNNSTEKRLKGISDQYEMRIRSRSGTMKWLLNCGTPWYNERGQVIGSIGALTDITERKEAENQLLFKNRELETFIYKASHDLKGPLSSTQGLVNVGKMMIEDEQSLELLDKISESTSKLETILEDLTQVALIQQGRVEPERIQFGEVAMDAITHFSDYPHFGKLVFEVRDDTEGMLISDLKLLRTIVRNLVENSIKYSNFQLDHPRVRITGHIDGNDAVIEVNDNGTGIPQDMQKRVFDMFFRASAQGKGSGLGLYIVKNALNKLDGALELDSQVGRGTTFLLRIPVVAVKEPTLEQKAE